MSSSGGFTAWGDESGSDTKLDPGAYVMGAAVIDPGAVEDVRKAVADLRLPRERKIHWRDDSDKRHDEVVDAMLGLKVEGFVVVRVGPQSDRSERRRRKTLEPFALGLAGMGCDTLTLESRGPADNRRDIDMVQALRSSRVLTEPMRVQHATGPAEPLLWIADALCGAVVSARRGDPRWLDRIETSTELVYV